MQDALVDETRRALVQNLLGYEYSFADEVADEQASDSDISLEKFYPLIGVCGGVVAIVLLMVCYQV